MSVSLLFLHFEMIPSNLGCRTGVGQGKMLSSGVCGGGGHGGKGGNGSYNGSLAEGGAIYGNADLPCELGCGSGNDSTELSTAGGGIIGTYAPIVLIFFGPYHVLILSFKCFL
jgi:hypothetical protein